MVPPFSPPTGVPCGPPRPQCVCCFCGPLPCGWAYYCPVGGDDEYMKLGSDCGPFCIIAKEDGTIDGTCQGVYEKDAAPEAKEIQRV